MTKHRTAPSWRDVYPVHPAADVFPMMSESELRELGEDIKENGLTSPIVFWRPSVEDGEYMLLDGRNRLDAMEKIGLPVLTRDPANKGWVFNEDTWRNLTKRQPGWRPALYLLGREHTTTFAFVKGGRSIDRVRDAVDPVAFVISANIRRRHLTKQQQAELIARAVTADQSAPENDPAKVARSFNPKPGKRGGSTRDLVKATVVKEAAKHDISPRTAERALQVVRGGPQEKPVDRAARQNRVAPRRPYTARMKDLVSAAISASEASDEEIAAIANPNELMLTGVARARDVLERVLETHAPKVKPRTTRRGSKARTQRFIDGTGMIGAIPELLKLGVPPDLSPEWRAGLIREVDAGIRALRQLKTQLEDV